MFLLIHIEGTESIRLRRFWYSLWDGLLRKKKLGSGINTYFIIFFSDIVQRVMTLAAQAFLGKYLSHNGVPNEEGKMHCVNAVVAEKRTFLVC